ncbi:GNAT family N-acetyltransferase [Thioalkalivibrio sulfidiphilus]|uniref:GNAT family N-acetyltransferase n=1 Tax=Thioalkalivibrio sulfidiphilus TaxID=1033854 RepID=UPI00037F824A|nr:GNAT family N-acetyltransferase [Thioalkalivibrio sulfidiphilus]
MSYQVTRADPTQSADKIAALWTEVFGPFSRERYRWLYQDNIAGESLLCLLHDAAGHEVGSTGLFPRRLCSRTQALSGAIAGDLMVDRKHRSLGPAVQLQRAALDCAAAAQVQLVYGFPNNKSAPIMQRVGYKRVGAMAEWVMPLRTDYYLRKRIPQAWLRRPVALLLDTGLRLRPALLKSAFARHRISVVTDHFDETFDDLWSRIASGYSLIGEKSADFLDWRYRRCPSDRRQAFMVKSADAGRLDGYVIFSNCDKRAHIADFAHDGQHLSLDELLLRFTLAQHKAGMDAVSLAMAASADIIGTVERIGFKPRGEMNPLMLFTPPGAGLELQDLLAGPWYLVPGDNDT